jgi:hypothetical protein
MRVPHTLRLPVSFSGTSLGSRMILDAQNSQRPFNVGPCMSDYGCSLLPTSWSHEESQKVVVVKNNFLTGSTSSRGSGMPGR